MQCSRFFFFFFFFFRINSEEEAGKQDYGVSPITPRSAAQLRLRFLSRVGQQVSKLQAKNACVSCEFDNLLSIFEALSSTLSLFVQAYKRHWQKAAGRGGGCDR